ncbi:MAG: DUF2996 domain-containing protein [Cyanobacteria bacterium Co-bin8]|nr:DUF2996 domain-containing protein [Cyanobacteria bacterium Co-bin8]
MAEEQTPKPPKEVTPQVDPSAPAGDAPEAEGKAPEAEGKAPAARAAGKAAAGEAKPKAAAGDAKPKKEKPPAVEDKPFEQFIQQDFLPSLDKALKQNAKGEIALSFKKQPLQVHGLSDNEEYWQVSGQWQENQRQFNIAFTDENIGSQKLFYCSSGDFKGSTVEQFMGDERKITLDLMLLYTLQRLNGQKWLNRN